MEELSGLKYWTTPSLSSEGLFWTKTNKLQRVLGPNSNLCVWRLPHSSKQFSEASSGRLRIQLNSNTIYLETESDSTGKGFSPTRLPSASGASHKLRLTNELQTGGANDPLQLRIPTAGPGYRYFWLIDCKSEFP